MVVRDALLLMVENLTEAEEFAYLTLVRAVYEGNVVEVALLLFRFLRQNVRVVSVMSLDLFALNEPRMLIGGVVHDKIHEHTQATLVRTVEHLFEDVKVALTVCSTNGFQNHQVYLGLTCSGKSYPQGWWPEGSRSVL